MPRSAPSTWKVKAGSVVITMMKKMRGFDAVKPDDREHHPGQRRNALKQRQDRRQELIDRARARHHHRRARAPMMNAPARPARMRNTVASTSLNSAQLEKISMQR